MSNILGILPNSLSTEDFPIIVKSAHDKNQLTGDARFKP